MRAVRVPVGVPKRHGVQPQEGAAKLPKVQEHILEQTQENNLDMEKQAAIWSRNPRDNDHSGQPG